jgi:hypothetical protein
MRELFALTVTLTVGFSGKRVPEETFFLCRGTARKAHIVLWCGDSKISISKEHVGFQHHRLPRLFLLEGLSASAQV